MDLTVINYSKTMVAIFQSELRMFDKRKNTFKLKFDTKLNIMSVVGIEIDELVLNLDCSIEFD